MFEKKNCCSPVSLEITNKEAPLSSEIILSNRIR
jgi:hypothetical protein